MIYYTQFVFRIAYHLLNFKLQKVIVKLIVVKDDDNQKNLGQNSKPGSGIQKNVENLTKIEKKGDS